MSFQDEMTERDRALIALDLEYARGLMPATTDEVRLVAMHKARYEVASIPRELRHASGAWLRERCYGRMCGPLLPEGELP